MNPGLLWITTFFIGGVATVLMSFGPLATFLFLLLGVPLVIRGPHLVALSGLLTGFGGVLTYLLARVFASAATQDNPAFWLMVALVPLASGLIILVLVARRKTSRAANA